MKKSLDINEIMRILPHRYPFLMIDGVIDYNVEEERCLQAVKNVSSNESFFQGHFPGCPVMPGVMVLEFMAQAAALLYVLVSIHENGDGYEWHIGYLTSLDSVRFRRQVVPGDRLIVDVKLTQRKMKHSKYNISCTVDGEKVATCSLSLYYNH